MFSNAQLISQKFKLIESNRDRFNAQQNKSIAELSSFQLSEQSANTGMAFSKQVQLETFYRCCIPAYENVFWEDEVNFKVAYPIAAIAAFKLPDEKYAAVDVKIATWAESGGLRLTPLKASLGKEKIKEIVMNSHALIIPEYEGEIEQDLFDILCELITESPDCPVLALGNSAVVIMSNLSKSPQLRKKTRLDLKFHNYEVNAFFSHEDPLIRDLDLKVRLEIENKARVVSSSVQLPVQLFNACKREEAKVIGVGKGRTDEWGVVAAKEGSIYYCFVDPRHNSWNSDHSSVCHKLIVNFMDQVRKREKKIEEKGLQLGQYKVSLKGDRFLYNVDAKLPKF